VEVVGGGGEDRLRPGSLYHDLDASAERLVVRLVVVEGILLILAAVWNNKVCSISCTTFVLLPMGWKELTDGGSDRRKHDTSNERLAVACMTCECIIMNTAAIL